MDKMYPAAIEVMTAALDTFAEMVPPPVKVLCKDGFFFRYKEQTLQQAIVQKLARIISGLNAALILLQAGYVQEQGALQRIMDEFQEDVTFLTHALNSGEVTDLHKAYLAAFYEEEFDVSTPMESSQKRPMIPRQKIRAFIARIENGGIDPSRGGEMARTLSKVYSGYVHGASPHIMEMYGGSPRKFHVGGLLGTPRVTDHAGDLWNYFYRGLIAFGITAVAFGHEKLYRDLRDFSIEFEKSGGKSYSKPAV